MTGFRVKPGMTSKAIFDFLRNHQNYYIEKFYLVIYHTETFKSWLRMGIRIINL